MREVGEDARVSALNERFAAGAVFLSQERERAEGARETQPRHYRERSKWSSAGARSRPIRPSAASRHSGRCHASNRCSSTRRDTQRGRIQSTPLHGARRAGREPARVQPMLPACRRDDQLQGHGDAADLPELPGPERPAPRILRVPIPPALLDQHAGPSGASRSRFATSPTTARSIRFRATATGPIARPKNSVPTSSTICPTSTRSSRSMDPIRAASTTCSKSCAPAAWTCLQAHAHPDAAGMADRGRHRPGRARLLRILRLPDGTVGRSRGHRADRRPLRGLLPGPQRPAARALRRSPETGTSRSPRKSASTTTTRRRREQGPPGPGRDACRRPGNGELARERRYPRQAEDAAHPYRNG